MGYLHVCIFYFWILRTDICMYIDSPGYMEDCAFYCKYMAFGHNHRKIIALLLYFSGWNWDMKSFVPYIGVEGELMDPL